VLTEPEDDSVFVDGTAAGQMPGCVVFVTRTEEVVSVLRMANEKRIPVVTRGSGTGLSGGSLPDKDGIVLCTVKMDKILELDRANLTMLVEPGATTQQIADAAEEAVCSIRRTWFDEIWTIGGTVAENSGGLRGLNRVTRNYVMGMEVVYPTVN
jgi:glycolate oxidase